MVEREGEKLCETKVEEALEKQLGRFGSSFSFVVGDAYYPYTRHSKPYIASHVSWMEETPKGTFLIADEGVGQVIEVDREYNILWSYGRYDKDTSPLSGTIKCAQMVQDYPSNGDTTIVISDAGNGRVIFVDYDSQDVIHEITSIDSGDLSSPYARFNVTIYKGEVREHVLAVHGLLTICDEDNHYVASVDLDGTEQSSFGEWGVPGSDATHLDSPTTATYEEHKGAAVDIADKGNDRILRYNPETDIYTEKNPTNEYIAPGVNQVYQRYRPGHQHAAVGGWHFTGRLEYGDGVLHYLHSETSRFCNHTRDGFKTIFRRHQWTLVEDIRSGFSNRRRRNKASWGPFQDLSLDSNETSKIYPFYLFPWKNVQIKIVSTEDATMNLKTPRLSSKSLSQAAGIKTKDVPATWDSFDSVSLTADTPEYYSFSTPVGIMGLEVVMGNTAGEVDACIEMNR